MSLPESAHELAQMLGTALEPGAGVAPAAATILAAIQRRVAGDRTAEATLTLFESDLASTDMQRRLATLLAARCSASEIGAWLAALRGQPMPPGVRSEISADEDGLVQDSGHKVLAPDGAVDLRTSAGKRGRIIGSPITVVGSGASVPTPPTPRATTPARGPLPATLSADGVHFSYGHALLIGVGSYKDSGLSVPDGTTANDARALAALLRDRERAAYPNEQVRVLLDGEATRARILGELAALAKRLAAAPGGTAVIFFAGHGEPHGTSYALLPHDVNRQNLDASAVTAALFHEAIANVRAQAKRLIVILNCCHAGGVGNDVLGTNNTLSGSAPPPEFYRPLALGSGQVVISSSRSEQKSGASSHVDPQHTTFGAHLLAALGGKAAGDGPGIGVFELFTYLRLHVPADAQNNWYGNGPLQQEPLLYAYQLDDNIAVALRPGDGNGGTLSGTSSDIARLIDLELQIEHLGAAAPPALLAERDAVLQRLGG